MTKAKELSEPDSCLNRAKDDELLFVLLSRDYAAPKTIRFWADLRIRLGMNKPDDAQIIEARACAEKFEIQHLEKYDHLY